MNGFGAHAIRSVEFFRPGALVRLKVDKLAMVLFVPVTEQLVVSK